MHDEVVATLDAERTRMTAERAELDRRLAEVQSGANSLPSSEEAEAWRSLWRRCDLLLAVE